MAIGVKLTWKEGAKKIKIKAATLRGALKELKKREEWGLFEGGISPSVKKNGDNVTELTIAGSCTIHMPEWSGYKSAPKACKEEWDRMWEALETHEKGHAKLYVDVVEKFADGLRKKEEAVTVEQIKALLKALDKKLDDDSDSYDTRTAHGEKDGATLNITSECE
jgi:predicted secreted Zn-dependent protease